ncbi:hypothetical protein LCGC14_2526040 [marine sediment metagenome]|uniref:Uncharacterized protein n=1 Tax=marine sediment metagenome TaxID=412755 RepID=A0A0F9DN96_9ZZZZ
MKKIKKIKENKNDLERIIFFLRKISSENSLKNEIIMKRLIYGYKSIKSLLKLYFIALRSELFI